MSCAKEETQRNDHCSGPILADLTRTPLYAGQRPGAPNCPQNKRTKEVRDSAARNAEAERETKGNFGEGSEHFSLSYLPSHTFILYWLIHV